MTDLSAILRVLEQERERYILEVVDLEHRLVFIRNQISNLDTLISGYGQEDQGYVPIKSISESSTQAYLVESRAERKTEKRVQEETQPDEEVTVSNRKKTEDPFDYVDVSDIPKLNLKRPPGTVLMVGRFREYSIQNAILILMRHRTDTHFHTDAIVRDLYGDKLSDHDWKTAKTNVGKMLSVGVQTGMWYRVLREPGVYTFKYEKGVTSKSVKRR
jgi:hypothetical protein